MTDEGRTQPKSTDGRDNKGRFARGNPGRKPGSRNRVNARLDAIFSNHAATVAEATIEAAKRGDVSAMRLVLERAFPAPKDRQLAPLDLPENPAEAAAAIVRAVAAGELTPSDGQALMALNKNQAELSAWSEIEQRLAALVDGL